MMGITRELLTVWGREGMVTTGVARRAATPEICHVIGGHVAKLRPLSYVMGMAVVEGCLIVLIIFSIGTQYFGI